MNIGWIGTGVMGSSMAAHLLRAGHRVRVYTRSRAKAQLLLDQGAEWAETPGAAAHDSAVVCSMVGYPRDVEEIYLGRDGVLAVAKPETVAIDFTTSSPTLARRLAERGTGAGVEVLDAPVSGGDIGARNGTLSIMVGGDADAFARVKPLLEHLGKTIVLQGPAGSGQHTKMVNQILLAGTMVGLAEGLLYARAMQLDPQRVLESVGGGAAASWSLQHLLPRILKGDLEPGFYVEHFIKDLGIALAEAEAAHLALPGIALAKQLYQATIACGGARKGTQALILALEALAGRGATTFA